MSIDEQHHIALPKLYGAPAYARPPMVAQAVVRPFDPDELPLEAQRTDEERELMATLPARAFASGGGEAGGDGPPDADGQPGGDGGSGLRPRPFDLRAVAGRLLGG